LRPQVALGLLFTERYVMKRNSSVNQSISDAKTNIPLYLAVITT
jgi:hypothetical protein